MVTTFSNKWLGSSWQRGIAESGSSQLSTLMIETPGDLVWDLPCVQQASCMEGGPLLWIRPLYLHVNQKSDDDDDDHSKRQPQLQIFCTLPRYPSRHMTLKWRQYNVISTSCAHWDQSVTFLEVEAEKFSSELSLQVYLKLCQPSFAKIEW